MRRPPSLSVIIPSFNRLSRIASLVEAYLAQGADEVVVVLDGPHPGWHEALGSVAALPNVRITELPANVGLALARIAGLRQTEKDVVLIADDDVVPGAGLIARHRDFHDAHPDHALLGYMPVDLPRKRLRDQSASFVYAQDYENQVQQWRDSGPEELLDAFWGGNASLPRHLYLRAEEYKASQRLNYNEDLDLGLRLRAVGALGAFDEQAKAVHQHRRSFASFKRECLVRGEAVADLEVRWDRLPEQLVGLVRVPETHAALAGMLQARIAARDAPGFLESAIDAAYVLFGLARAWRAQDAVARFVRRSLAMRGYRLAKYCRILMFVTWNSRRRNN